MTTLEYDLDFPPHMLPLFIDACAPLRALVSTVEIAAYRRPDEHPYWLVCVKPLSGKCIALSTFELRHLPLSEQVPDICRQMQELAPMLLDWLQKMPVGPARLSTLLDES